MGSVRLVAPIKVAETKLTSSKPDVGVSGVVIVEDATGAQWAVPFSYFTWDLLPYSNKQELDYFHWKQLVVERSRQWFVYPAAPLSEEEMFAAYRDGKSPEDIYPKER